MSVGAKIHLVLHSHFNFTILASPNCQRNAAEIKTVATQVAKNGFRQEITPPMPASAERKAANCRACRRVKFQHRYQMNNRRPKQSRLIKRRAEFLFETMDLREETEKTKNHIGTARTNFPSSSASGFHSPFRAACKNPRQFRLLPSTRNSKRRRTQTWKTRYIKPPSAKSNRAIPKFSVARLLEARQKSLSPEPSRTKRVRPSQSSDDIRKRKTDRVGKKKKCGKPVSLLNLCIFSTENEGLGAA